jgi:hypothetical protein
MTNLYKLSSCITYMSGLPVKASVVTARQKTERQMFLLRVVDPVMMDRANQWNRDS